MKMTTCKACGKEIAKSAKVCPNCGKKNGIPLVQKLGIAVGIIVVIAVIANMGNDSDNSGPAQTANEQSGSENSQEEPKPEATVISPVDLLNAYDDNEVKADKLYKGKMLQLTGTISDIGKDILDEPYITFSKGEYEITSVQVYFKNSEDEKLAAVSKGQQITVVGKCDGKTMNVVLKDSVFQE